VTRQIHNKTMMQYIKPKVISALWPRLGFEHNLLATKRQLQISLSS